MPEGKAEEKIREFVVPPYIMELDNAKVHVLEVVKLKGFGINTNYASVFVEWNCYRSPPFHVMFDSYEEFIVKLRVEIAKMKSILLSGNEHIYKKVC